MATASLTPYYNNAAQTTFALVSTSATGATWKVASLGIPTPHSVKLERKLAPSGSKSNDHVVLTVSQTKRNATTSLLSTANVTLDISIPRDTAAVSNADVVYLLGELASLLDESTALNAATVARSALVDGRDL